MAENKSEAYLEKKVLGGVTEQIVAQEKTLREVSAKLDNIDIPVSSLLRIRVYEQTFEDGTSDLTTYNCTQEVQTDQVFGGSYSLKVTIPAGQTGYVVTPSRPVSPYQRVTFSFAHKEEGDVAEVKLVAVWRRSSGGIISTEELNLTPSPEWNVDSITVVAPKQAASMELRMEATAGTSDAYVYLDEITIDLVGQIFKVDGAGNLQINIAAEEVGLLKEGGTVNIASGTVSVDNFPTEYPLPDTQVSDLKNVTIVNTPLDVNITNTSLTITGSVSVDNFPSDYPDSGTHSRLDTIHADLYDSASGDKTITVLQDIRDKVATETTLSSIGSKIVICDTSNISGSVSVTNFPTDYPDSTTHSKLDTINTTLQSELTRIAKIQYYDGTVWRDWDKTVTVENFPSDYPDSTAHLKLDTIHSDLYDSSTGKTTISVLQDLDTKVVKCDTDNIGISGSQIAYDSTNDVWKVSGSVSVTNFPSEYPLPSSQVTDLKNITITGSSIAYDSTADRLKVALPYDARDRNWTLSSSTDSVTVTGTVNVGNWRTSSTGSYGSVSVGTSATQILASNSNRKALIIYNNGDTTVYIGLDSNVTTTSGMPLPPYAYMHVKDYTGPVYGIVSSGSADVRYVELS